MAVVFIVARLACHFVWIYGGQVPFSRAQSPRAIRLQGLAFGVCMLVVAGGDGGVVRGHSIAEFDRCRAPSFASVWTMATVGSGYSDRIPSAAAGCCQGESALRRAVAMQIDEASARPARLPLSARSGPS